MPPFARILLALVVVWLGSALYHAGVPAQLHKLRTGATVAIWQSDPNIAWTRRTLALGPAEPPIRSDVRSVVVRRDGLPEGIGAELIVAWAVTDDERRARTSSQYVLAWEREPELRYRGRVRDASGQSVAFTGKRYRWRYSFEVVFEVPASFVWPSRSSATVELEMSAELGDRAIVSYGLTLRPVNTPRAALAVCNKPMYNPPSAASIATVTECASRSYGAAELTSQGESTTRCSASRLSIFQGGTRPGPMRSRR